MMREATQGILVVTCLLLVVAAGCTDAGNARRGSYGEEFNITLYAHDGSVIQQWISTGRVGWRRNGFYFVDKTSGKFVMLTGAVIVESVNPR